MNYVQHVLEDLKELLPDCPDALLDSYALLTLSLGFDVTNTDVHDAWSLWQNKARPDHRSIIEYEQLDSKVQDLDTKYTKAIHQAYRKYLERLTIIGE